MVAFLYYNLARVLQFSTYRIKYLNDDLLMTSFSCFYLLKGLLLYD